MATNYKHPYLETTVWLGWIKGEICEGVDRKHMMDDILSHAARGEYPVHTSTITLTEVRKPRGGTSLPDAQDDSLLRYFEHKYIQLISVDREVAEQANRLAREFNLETCDAIHLASALRAHCDYLLTWDDKLLKVRHPGIQIAKPEITEQPVLLT